MRYDTFTIRPFLSATFASAGGEGFREAAGVFFDLIEDAALPAADCILLAVIAGAVS